MKTKKIISVVAIAFLLVITACVIACSFIKKNFNMNLNAPSNIQIYKDGVSSPETILNSGETADEYEKIMKLYNESFKVSFLNALFQGKAFNDVIIDDDGAYQNLTESSINSLTTENKMIMRFFYDEPQKLMLKGKEYKTSYAYNEYNDIFIEVVNSSSMTVINAYAKYQNSGSSSLSYYRYVTYASQSNLFEYLNDIV